MCLCVRVCVYSFRVSVHSCIRVFVYSCIRVFVCSGVHAFECSCVCVFVVHSWCVRDSLEDALVISNCLMTVTRRGDNNVGTTRKETFKDFNSNRAFSNASEKGILVLEDCSRCCDLAEEVKIDTGEVAGILPGTSRRALEMK